MRISVKASLALLLLIQIIVLKILKQFPEIVEHYYSNGVYIYISKALRYVFGWLPFSFGDVGYTLGAILIIKWLISHRHRVYKDTKKWLIDVLAVVSVIYLAFNTFWGFNYYRQPLNVSLGIEDDYTTEELIAVTKALIKKSNAVHSTLVSDDSIKVSFSYSKIDILNRVPNGYDALSKIHPEFSYTPSSIKASLYSLPLIYMGFSGYLNPFTNEAQVDHLIPTYKYPTTASHEVAHQIGYAAENEANFIGALAAINHNDSYFKYSGYTFALRYCLSEIYKRDKQVYKTLLKTINTGILKNYKEAQDFWLSYKNTLEPMFDNVYDTFLKANSQSKGVDSYSYVVALFVNYFQEYPL